jgi:hypothetical protein
VARVWSPRALGAGFDPAMSLLGRRISSDNRGERRATGGPRAMSSRPQGDAQSSMEGARKAGHGPRLSATLVVVYANIKVIVG